MNNKFFSIIPAPLKVFWLTHFYKPSLFLVETTNICNLRCTTCPWHTLMTREKKMMTFDEYKGIFSNIRRYTKRVCLYVLGEPFINPDIFKIINFTENNGVKAIISSNGMLLGKFLEQILASKLSFLQIAFDGWRKEIHEKHRVNSNLDLIKKYTIRLSRLKRERKLSWPEVTIQMLVNKLNEKEVEKVKNFALRYADHFNLKKMNFGKDKKIAEKNRKLFEPQSDDFKRIKENGDYFKNMRVCPQLLQINVLVDGTVVPCCYDFDGRVPWGNIKIEKLTTVLTGKKRKKFLNDFFRRKAILCRECDFVKDMQMKVF